MTTFISYARGNSNFAVRLARDLRAAGFDIWLDQLDIRTGARWDDEVEKALEKSSTFLIILTSESIQSQNVKDEIGYAIDAGKHILPIILKPCNVPFRLRRFQYVDFSNKPYQESFAEIKQLLANPNELASVKGNKEDSIRIENPVSTLEPEKTKPPHKWNTLIGIGVLSALVIALINILPLILSRQANSQTLTPVFFSSSKTAVPLLTETLETSLTSTEALTSTPIPLSPAPLPAQITDAKGVTMRLVPAGEFTMGSDSGNPNEQPAHQIYLDAFYMDMYEVTNALYKACVDVSVCDPPREVSSSTHSSYYGNHEFDNYPVIYMDWFQAKNYCEWRGAYLPTEAQWEKAARGTDGRTYPWGEGIGCDKANFSTNCVTDVTEVGRYETGKSPYGIYDMAGNVWEWVGSLYNSYPYDSSDGREDLNSFGTRLIRGGSWDGGDSYARSSFRFGYKPTVVIYSHGFRCAKDANP